MPSKGSKKGVLSEVPLHLLKEAIGHQITAEVKSGEAYTGKLLNAENTMNLHISDVISKSKTGQSTHLETIYLRGSHIKLIVLPEILRHGPFFTKVKTNLKRKLEEREKNDDENRKNKKQKKK